MQLTKIRAIQTPHVSFPKKWALLLCFACLCILTDKARTSSHVRIVADSHGTCLRSTPYAQEECMPKKGDNIRAYVPAGVSWAARVDGWQWQSDGLWLHLEWVDGFLPAGWMRYDVVELDL